MDVNSYELFNYPGDVYCIICDADISRAWVCCDVIIDTQFH